MSFSTLAIMLAVVSLGGVQLAGQAPAEKSTTKAAATRWTPPRTVDGQPDLQGVWELHLTERLTRVSDETLLYEFTLSDPRTFMKPWSAQMPMRKSDQAMYEYACHEGNYGLHGILSGARADEKAAAAKKETK